MSQYRIGQLFSIYSITENQENSTFTVILKFLLNNNKYRFCKTYMKKQTKIEELIENSANFTEILLPLRQPEEEKEIKTPWDCGAIYKIDGEILDAIKYKQDIENKELNFYNDKQYGYIAWHNLAPETTYQFNLGFSDAEITYEKITDTINPEVDDISFFYVYDKKEEKYKLNGAAEYDAAQTYYTEKITYFPSSGYCDFPLIYTTPSSTLNKINNYSTLIGNFLETPRIDNNLQAFFNEQENLVFPFYLSSQYQSYNLQIKMTSIYDGKTIFENNKDFIDYYTDNFEKSIVITPASLKEKKWSPGVYKIQIRLVGKTTQSDWSNVSFVKVLSAEPNIYITNNIMTNTNIETVENSLTPIFKGIFQGPADESLLWYSFKILNKNNEIIEQTEQLYDFEKELEIGQDLQKIKVNYQPSKPLSSLEKYTLYFKIYTVNGFMKEIKYIFSVQDLKRSTNTNLYLKVKIDTENGKNQLYIKSRQLEQINLNKGEWVLCRLEQKTNFSENTILNYFSEKDLIKSKDIPFYEDYIIESGEAYKYYLYYKNYSGEYTEQITVDEDQMIINNFEFCYLYGQNKQLKLKLNNTLNSFKKTILQSKQDTLGGAFPVIVRNGLAYYAEFPVSALITFHTNDNEFLKEGEAGYYYDEELVIPANKYQTEILNENYLLKDNKLYGQQGIVLNNFNTNIEENNIFIEKVFRNKVEDFLNNGELKLFKSPTEGNFIVSLINVAFTPNQQLSRMVASFTSTAYEMMAYNFDNIYKANIICKPQELEISEYFSDSIHWFHEHIGVKKENDESDPKYTIEENLALKINSLSQNNREVGELLHNIKYVNIYNRGNKTVNIVFKNQNQISVQPCNRFIIPLDECNNFDSAIGENFDIDIIVTTQYFVKRKKIAMNQFPLMFSFKENEQKPLCYRVKIKGIKPQEITEKGFYLVNYENDENFYKLYYINLGEDDIFMGLIPKDELPFEIIDYEYSNFLLNISEIHNQILKWKNTNVLLDWQLENDIYESQLDSYFISSFKALNIYNTIPQKEQNIMINNEIISLYDNLYINTEKEEDLLTSLLIPAKCKGYGVASILYTHREGGIYNDEE